jgi:tripartite-type tricarboxylate transporter receptor subunit TctC
MAKNVGLITLSLFLLVAFGSTAHGQEFYNNKTIRIVVGFSPGGGMDIYGRAIGRHLGKNIPGKPNVIVENMPGAGSLIAANYLYKQAKPDGLTIGSWIGGLVLQQVIGGQKGIEFDARKFEWIGVPAGDSSSCAVTKAGGVTSIEQWFAAKTPVKIGAMAPGSVTSDIPKILKAALNLPIQVVEGYKGTAEIRVAADSGEVDGGCWGWETIKIMWRQGLEAGNTKVLIQMLPKRHPDLPDVPNALELAKTQDARQLIKVGIVDPATMVRALSLPPGTPKDRVKILRDAFMATMKDPQFLAEAKTAKLDLIPMPGEEVEKIVHGFFALEPRSVANLRDVVMSKH